MYTPPPTEFQAAVRRNSFNLCSAPHCGKSRVNIGKHCKAHHKICGRYGHPHARPIKRPDVQWAREKVSDLFASNATHAGLVAATAWTRQWFAEALAAPSGTTHRDNLDLRIDLQRLDARGITADDILKEAVAFSIFTATNERAFPDTRSADYGMSRSILGLAPKAFEVGPRGTVLSARPYKTAALRTIGTTFRLTLAGFMASVRNAVEQESKKKEALRNALHAPFNAPASMYQALVAELPVAPQ